jgi:hypothetical protein
MASVAAIEIPLNGFLAVAAVLYGEWREAPYREWSGLELVE